MANKQKNLKKFGQGGGRHSSKRKVLRAREKWYRHEYSCYLKDESSSCVVVIKRKKLKGRKKVKIVQRRNLKKFYQLYRSPETGQLRKRNVKRFFNGNASGYR